MKRLLLLLLLISKSLFVVADLEISRIDIVAALDNPATVEVAANIQRTLQQAQLGIDTTVQDLASYQNNKPSNTLVIALGDNALPWLSNRKNSTTAAIAFQVNSFLFNHQNFPEQHFTALYRDQPLLRQLRLGKLLIPELQRVVILHGAQEPLPNISFLQHESQLSITEIRTDNQPDWLKELSLSLRDHGALIGVDDPSVYNSETIRSILLTAYRHGRGVIGPSRAFVNAGSLASCHTSSDQYLQQLVNMVVTTLHRHRLPHAQYPQIFNVVINKQVAISLNIPIPDENTLSARLQDHNGECGNGC